MRNTLLLLLLLAATYAAYAQTIKGETLDMEGKKALPDVAINNIHTNASVTTGSDGAFSIAAASGQLLEFRASGYKTARVRIPDGQVPPFFRIILSANKAEPARDLLAGTTRYDYKEDSIRNWELYKHVLEVPRLSATEKIQHPFTAMSKHYQEIWQFQEDFKEFEQQKYVDRTFNEQIVARFTGLKADSAREYMRRFRPSYEQLRSMNDYTFFQYVRSTVRRFRSFGQQRDPQ